MPKVAGAEPLPPLLLSGILRNLYMEIEDVFSFVAASSVTSLSLLSAAWSRTQLFGPYPR